tara:strand:+ start:282 stop:1193 length:912 start_codon:yes stop_codon:yes gene_type:complete
MAYQNILKPRVYLNIPEYLASTGVMAIDDLYRILPVGSYSIGGTENIIPIASPFDSITVVNKPYMAFLGHNFSNVAVITDEPTFVDIINGTSGDFQPGFSIMECKFNGEFATPSKFTIGGVANVGSVVYGTYYDFRSPDLNLSLSYEYDGIKEITTKGGSTLTNQFYNKPPRWGSLGAWEFGGTAYYAKSGRRTWDLSWSTLEDSTIFPDNAGLISETGGSESQTDPRSGNDNLLTGDTFQRVIHLTNGGQIPFIFQSDSTVSANTSPKPDQLAIAKFDMSSFKFNQVANNVYDCKIKIREVW